MKSDAFNHAEKCKTCQMHARKTCWDRVPIKPVERHEQSFMHWHLDIAGPMSSEKMQYPFCLLLLDSMSRYPIAFAIKSPTAKNICDCLLKVWMYFGIPRFVSADNATCNVANLTQELLKRFGVCPRFITPSHSEGNAAVERLIGTTKRLIAKTAADHPKSWHQHLPFIMWALREVPSELTNVPPWLLAMGTIPRGPLAVLRETWTGEREMPPTLGKGPTEYLKELYDNLEIAKKYAAAHSERMQQTYVGRYNTRARDKHFEIGDQVLILQPDSTESRLFASWKGPAEVVGKPSPYSYVVELEGVRHKLHANNLRNFRSQVNEVRIDTYGFGGPEDKALEDDQVQFDPDVELHAQVGTCAFIREEDEDFGNVQSWPPGKEPPESYTLPSQRIDLTQLSHLSESERGKLLNLLDKYPDVFRDEPGLYQGVQHTIPVSEDFHPRRLKEYKIPEKIKPEVTRQIQELLDRGIIIGSNSAMASPLVCILKGPGGRDGVRLAVDFRFLNRYTVSDAFPIPDIQDTIQKIGHARYISLTDFAQGYWQTKIVESDQWKTAFICDDELYE